MIKNSLLFLVLVLNYNFCNSQQVKEIKSFNYDFVMGDNPVESWYKIEAVVKDGRDSTYIISDSILVRSSEESRFPYSFSIIDNVYIGTRCYHIGNIVYCQTEDSIHIYFPFNFNIDGYLATASDTNYVLFFSRILQNTSEPKLFCNNPRNDFLVRCIFVENDTATLIRIQKNDEKKWILIRKKTHLLKDNNNCYSENEIILLTEREIRKLQKVLEKVRIDSITPGVDIHLANILIEIYFQQQYYLRFKNKTEIIEYNRKVMKLIKHLLKLHKS